jgi:hypothetical protein
VNRYYAEDLRQDLAQATLHQPDGGRPGPYDTELASGRYLNLRDPDPGDIGLDDVAVHLSRLVRYTGASTLSVAEHATLVAEKLRRDGAPLRVQLAGLHHDDTEFALGDVSRVLKQLLGDYRILERRMTAAVEIALDLQDLPWDDPRIKQADMWALAAEAKQLMPSGGKGWVCDGLVADGEDSWVWDLGWTRHAAPQYLRAHRRLLNDIAAEGST